MPLSGKVVLITGGARGMGREYVRGFLKEGAKVIATDQSWAPTGVSGDDYDFRPELAGTPNVLVEVMDITIDSHIKRVYEAAMAKFGAIDVIVNNAGMRARDLYPPIRQHADYRDRAKRLVADVRYARLRHVSGNQDLHPADAGAADTAASSTSAAAVAAAPASRGRISRQNRLK